MVISEAFKINFDPSKKLMMGFNICKVLNKIMNNILYFTYRIVPEYNLLYVETLLKSQGQE